MRDRAQLCWYDGERYDDGRFPIAANEPGLIFGATVFSTMRVYGGGFDDPRTAWPAHRRRLEGAIAAFGWPQPSWESIDRGLETLLPHYPVLRVTLFPDGRELVSGRYLPDDLADMQREGIAVWVAPSDRHARSLAGYKTGNYLGAWSALQAARSRGLREAILTDESGNWLETSTGNLWGYRDGVWHTPPTDGSILPGIVRQRILDSLRSRQISVDDREPWTPELWRSFEVLAYSNSGVEVVPIVRVEFEAAAGDRAPIASEGGDRGRVLAVLRQPFAEG
ncbi:MAG: aminotransferase class IV [Geitlerinemataceae cyanobacterium]